jgi:chlorobactene glucosyltransferase
MISSIACLLGIFIVTILHNQSRLDLVVRLAPPSTDAPLISVIVPARNEERNIRRCMDALLTQTYPNFEIIILDDLSTDATPQILTELADRDPRLKIFRGGELPDGWAGKPHALFQAAQQARGEWLCFVDSDTFAVPEALASVHAEAVRQSADLFTIMTRQELGSFWEKVVLPLVFTALSVGFSPGKVNDPAKPDAIANGQFIFIKRTVYESIGGHAAIKGSIVEDKDLAALTKHSGFRLVMADGAAMATTRMYTSLSEMWEGWTKNIFLGLSGSRGLLLLGAFGAFVSVMAALALPLWLAGGLVWWGAGGGSGALMVAAEGAVLWGYLIFWRMLALQGMDIPAWYAFTVPLGAGIFAAMIFTSTWKVLSGQGVTWKGRTYSKRS